MSRQLYRKPRRHPSTAAAFLGVLSVRRANTTSEEGDRPGGATLHRRPEADTSATHTHELLRRRQPRRIKRITADPCAAGPSGPTRGPI
jgi:hypothetical protein